MPQATVTSIVESFLEDGYTARDFSNLLPYVGRQKVASITDLHSMLNMLLLADAVSDKGEAALHACLDFLDPLVQSAIPVPVAA